MSLEWARARALQNEARLRRLVKSATGNNWTESTLAASWVEAIWLEPKTCRFEPRSTTTDSDRDQSQVLRSTPVVADGRS
jgi:hypothetical protein